MGIMLARAFALEQMLIMFAAIYLDAEVCSAGKREPGAGPQQKDADCSRYQGCRDKRNCEGQHQLIG